MFRTVRATHARVRGELPEERAVSILIIIDSMLQPTANVLHHPTQNRSLVYLRDRFLRVMRVNILTYRTIYWAIL